MAKVERHYSRKVGDSFRRDKEHLALFEELGLHEDLDSSLENVESTVPSGYEESAQGGLEKDDLDVKSEDEWLVAIPDVPPSPQPSLKSLVRNDSLSSIRTSRSTPCFEEPDAAALRRNPSPMRNSTSPNRPRNLGATKSPRPQSPSTAKSPRPQSPGISKSPRPAFTISSKRSTPSIASSKSSSTPISTSSAVRSSTSPDRKSVV